MKISMSQWDAMTKLAELYELTLDADGCVVKTKKIGICWRARPKQANEDYATVSVAREPWMQTFDVME
jgi:hypothetical protein